MLKKTLLAVLFVGLIGLLVFGAVNRTLAKTGSGDSYGGGHGNGQTALAGDSQSYGQAGLGGGGQGNGQGYGAEGNGGSQAYSGDGTATGQAVVDEWLTLTGAVTAADADLLTVDTGSGEVAVENRGWWYAQEQGFVAQVGDQVTLTGFYEGDAFEVGRIDNLTTGQTVTLRDENGRPLWAGRGRRGG